jgi:hypothetical protein
MRSFVATAVVVGSILLCCLMTEGEAGETVEVGL